MGWHTHTTSAAPSTTSRQNERARGCPSAGCQDEPVVVILREESNAHPFRKVQLGSATDCFACMSQRSARWGSMQGQRTYNVADRKPPLVAGRHVRGGGAPVAIQVCKFAGRPEQMRGVSQQVELPGSPLQTPGEALSPMQ